MIKRDRELLGRAVLVNRHLGEIVLQLLADSGDLPADGIRELGKGLVKLGTDFLARAEEIDGNPITRVIIDARAT